MTETKINEIIQSIKTNVVEPSDRGYAKDAKDFFEQEIKWQFQHKDEIISTHRALLEYVKRKDAVFAIRLYGSAPKDKYDLLRRGFLSEYSDGLKYFFCDNTFCSPFAALKTHQKSYTALDLVEHLSQKDIVCSFGVTSKEKELSYYRSNSKNRINLNTYGWYLAHIIPVGTHFKGLNSLSKEFKNPDRKEWSSNAEHIRYVEKPLSEDERAILVAHFLRLMHPLNSFLVPKKSLVSYNGKNLGEEEELINIVQDYIQAEFSKEYQELQDLMQIPEREETSNPVGEIAWSKSKKSRHKIARNKQRERKVIKRVRVKDKYDEDKEYRLERTLKSIGKKAFVQLYGLLKNNPNVTIEDIEKAYPEFKEYKTTKLRLSSTRSIIENGLAVEALKNILKSSRVNEESAERAKVLLEKLP